MTLEINSIKYSLSFCKMKCGKFKMIWASINKTLNQKNLKLQL